MERSGVALFGTVVVAHSNVDIGCVGAADRRVEAEGRREGVGAHRSDRIHLDIATTVVIDREDNGVDGSVLGDESGNVGVFGAVVEDVVSISTNTCGAKDLLCAFIVVEVDTAAVGLLVILGIGGHDSHRHFVIVFVCHIRREGGGGSACRIVFEHRGTEGDTLEAIGIVTVGGVGFDRAYLFFVGCHGDGHEECAITYGVVFEAVRHTVIVAAADGIAGVVTSDIGGVVDILWALVAVFGEDPLFFGGGEDAAVGAVAFLEHNPIVAVGTSTVDGRLLPSCCTEIPVVPVGRLLEGLTHLAADNFKAFVVGADDIVAVGLLVGIIEPLLVVVAGVACTVPNAVQVESTMRFGDDVGLGGV